MAHSLGSGGPGPQWGPGSAFRSAGPGSASAGAISALVCRVQACYPQRVNAINLLTVAVFLAMWLGLAGFFFVVVRFIVVNRAKAGPHEQVAATAPTAEGEAADEDESALASTGGDRRDFEFGL